MKTRYLLALLLALALALSVMPALAQGGVQGSGFCAGGNTTIEAGEQADNLTLFGCNGLVKSGATIRGDAAVFGGNLVVEKGATISGDIAIFGGSTQVGGEVKGDIAIMGGGVNLDSGSVVDGAVRVLGGSYNRSEGATVRGGISRNDIRVGPSFGRVFVPNRPFSSGFNLFGSIFSALALAALGALLVVFFPEPTRRVMATAQTQPGPSLGVGCVTMVLVPVLLVVFTITLIGIPITVLLSILWVVAIVFGWIAIGYFAGERIMAALKVNNRAPVLAVFVGVLLLALIGAVECLGPIISLLVATLGLGAVVLSRGGTRLYPYYPALAGAGPYPPAPGSPAPVTPTSANPAPLYPAPGTPPPMPPAPLTPGGPDNPNPEER